MDKDIPSELKRELGITPEIEQNMKDAEGLKQKMKSISNEADKIKIEQLEKNLAELREAIAEYMYSEGCSCCRSDNHEENRGRIAKLLNVKKYSDGSGYDFSRYRKEKASSDG